MAANCETGNAVCSVVLSKALHGGSARQVAQAAARHIAYVTLAVEKRLVDAQSVLAIVTLCAIAGTEVGIMATGPDAAAATQEIAALLLEPEA